MYYLSVFHVSLNVGGIVGRALDLRSMGSISTGTKLHNNLGQVVHTSVPLSPSSITWYWSKDCDVLWL